MPFLDNKYADLTSYRVANFRVMGLTGRDAAGAPRWEVKCGNCHTYQIIGHTRLAQLIERKHSQQSLFCTNVNCPASRIEHKAESLSDIRQRERLEAENAAKAEADRQKAAQIEVAKHRAAQERIEARKSEWREYVTHALLEWDQSLDELPRFPEWENMGQEVHRIVLDRIRTKPEIPFPPVRIT